MLMGIYDTLRHCLMANYIITISYIIMKIILTGPSKKVSVNYLDNFDNLWVQYYLTIEHRDPFISTHFAQIGCFFILH